MSWQCATTLRTVGVAMAVPVVAVKLGNRRATACTGRLVAQPDPHIPGQQSLFAGAKVAQGAKKRLQHNRMITRRCKKQCHPWVALVFKPKVRLIMRRPGSGGRCPAPSRARSPALLSLSWLSSTSQIQLVSWMDSASLKPRR